ncbi:hypothetical protein ACFSUJ_19970 [Streptomyces lusitanus]|uniref:WXG100 family type VII secretion target n=1 Tax=Streptomyces lusitanus TaxID=68232 RepID=A0ABU3JWA5_9ACTN|nr:hypothetical protein [Streptomyces lusitanus]
MSDLTVDLALLTKSSKQLKAIRNEFAHLGEWKVEITSSVGASELKGAMTEFIDNWSDNRKRLLESLESVGTMVEATREAFQSLEDELTRSGEKKER